MINNFIKNNVNP